MKALVLSGGAALGAYQAGCWEALSDAGWRPDVAIGVSIGAVNAFAVSRGASSAEMHRLWLELPAQLRPAASWSPLPWRRHVGLFREWVKEVFGHFAPRPQVCELRAVVLEAPNLGFRSVRGSEVTAGYLAAACALPGVMRPVRVDGSWLFDAGILRNLPLREALDCGANEIVSVDLLANHPIPMARTARKAILGLRDLAHQQRSEPRESELEPFKLIRVEHEVALGSLLGCFEWRREHAAELVAFGRQDTANALARSGADEGHEPDGVSRMRA